MRKFFNVISVYLAAVILLSMVVGCSNPDIPALPKLSTPEVTIGSDGVATWDSVPNAIYYIYEINFGDEKPTVECEVQLADNQAIRVKAVSGSEQYADSDFSECEIYLKGPESTKLSTPSVSINASGVATWGAVGNAQYYYYVIDNGTETKTTDRSIHLVDGQTIKVKAGSDDANYTDSDYSQSVTYTQGIAQIKLSTPSVSINASGVATWGAISNAQYYVYVINGGTETKTTALNVTLTNNQSIRVKAGSDSAQYIDSDYSQLQTYKKNTTPPPDYTLPAAVQAYYSAKIKATSGNELLGQVHDLITETHTYYTSYGECSESRYVNVTDPGPNGGALEFYTQKSIMSFSGNIGDWNREHVWCKSLSNGMWTKVSNSTKNGGTDMHHIRPAECGLNSTRGSYKFGKVTGGKEAWSRNKSGNDVALGGYVGGGAFEPLDKVKGDVARIVLYVYTHYNTYANVHGTTNGDQSGVFGTLKFTNIMSPTSESAAIQLLLEWNALDPVDEIERVRNDEVYKIQGNRNPFIDHPEYANAIWG